MKTLFSSHLFKALLPVAVLLTICVPMWINGYKIHSAKAEEPEPFKRSDPNITKSEPVLLYAIGSTRVFAFTITERNGIIASVRYCTMAKDYNVSNPNVSLSCTK